MKILSIVPTVPYEGIAHAGGQYYYDHLSELVRQGHQIHILAPNTPDNVDALSRSLEDVTVELVEPDRRFLTPLGGLTSLIINFVRLVTPGAQWHMALLDGARRRLPRVDIVETHWPHYSGLLPALARESPTALLVALPHDLLSQKVGRERGQGSMRVRLRAHITLARLRRLEADIYRRVDHVLVFSDDDAQILAGAGVTSVRVLTPPLTGFPGAATRAKQGQRALFVGAFDRDVNHESAMWFLRHVWPRVLTSMPAAELVLGGGGVRPELLELAGRAGNVVVSGYVRDLGSLYGAADAVVAPVLFGAGLKFKVATALLSGLPTVVTSVAAEGYPADKNLFVVVADESEEFAAGVIEALAGGERVSQVAVAAKAWADARFTHESFARSVEQIYGQPSESESELPPDSRRSKQS